MDLESASTVFQRSLRTAPSYGGQCQLPRVPLHEAAFLAPTGPTRQTWTHSSNQRGELLWFSVVPLDCCSGSGAKRIILLNKDFPCITEEADFISSCCGSRRHRPGWEDGSGLREWRASHFVIQVLRGAASRFSRATTRQESSRPCRKRTAFVMGEAVVTRGTCAATANSAHRVWVRCVPAVQTPRVLSNFKTKQSIVSWFYTVRIQTAWAE